MSAALSRRRPIVATARRATPGHDGDRDRGRHRRRRRGAGRRPRRRAGRRRRRRGRLVRPRPRHRAVLARTSPGATSPARRPRRAVHRPLWVENDANAAAWAEYRFGAARARDLALLITLGTGIGGGIVLDGPLYRGAFGVAGEFGHMQVVPDGRRCGCGNRGCWEQYASGSALARRARGRAARRRSPRRRLLELVDGDVDRLTGAHVTARPPRATRRRWSSSPRSAAGSGGARRPRRRPRPGVFVIGGGVSESGEMLLRPGARRISTARCPAAASGPGRGSSSRCSARRPASSAPPTWPGVPRESASGGSALDATPGTSSPASCSRNSPTSVTMPSACDAAAVGQLGDRRRVDVHADQRDRRRQDVAGRDRVQHRRDHDREADAGQLRPASRAGPRSRRCRRRAAGRRRAPSRPARTPCRPAPARA